MCCFQLVINVSFPVFSINREVSKPLIPLGKAGVLLVNILTLLSKEMVRVKQSTFHFVLSE